MSRESAVSRTTGKQQLLNDDSIKQQRFRCLQRWIYIVLYRSRCRSASLKYITLNCIYLNGNDSRQFIQWHICSFAVSFESINVMILVQFCFIAYYVYAPHLRNSSDALDLSAICWTLPVNFVDWTVNAALSLSHTVANSLSHSSGTNCYLTFAVRICIFETR